MSPYHPSIAHMLRQFDYAHLPEHLARVSEPFYGLAHQLAERTRLEGANGTETTAALRKLREAKDCAVLAVVLGS